jgi:hypothetical protein
VSGQTAATPTERGEQPSHPSPGRRTGKRLLFRLLAVFLSLSPLLAAELVFRALDIGRPTDYDDPFVGFSDVHPLFVLNEKTGKYEVPPSRYNFFRPESFAAEKPAREFRIFVLGGSTVQGRPYEIETSFTTWLELSLNAAAPSRHWEVVNCGGISYASYRLIPILQEILGYRPDHIIVCTGQNEFLEERSYEHIKYAPAVLSWPQRQASRLRTFTVLHQTIFGSPKDRPVLGPETDPMLDWKGGMAKYHRDPEWQAGVVAHYEFNLRRMVDLARDAGVPLTFLTPVNNLEWPPFKPQHREGITADERAQFQTLIDRARRLYSVAPDQALELLEQAAAIDDQHALVHFEIGMCCQSLLDMRGAKKALTRAKDLDVCPLRMLESQVQLLHQVARETSTPLVDAQTLIAAQSRGGIPGNRWLVDHVHPSIEGHQLIAQGLLEELLRQQRLAPEAGWEKTRERAYREHWARLHQDPEYFVRAQRQLKAVQGWGHGKVTQEKGTKTPRQP